MKRRFLMLLLLFGSIALLLRTPRGSAQSSSVYLTNLARTNILGTNYFLGIRTDNGTNDTFLVPVANIFSGLDGFYVGTNSLRFTNECYVAFGVNTNLTISVSNAGLAAVNGLYRTNLLDGYTQGVYKVCFDSIYGSFVISNASQRIYGFDDVGDTGIGNGLTWVDDFLSNPPKPVSWWGPATNCFTVLALSAGLAQPILSSNLYVQASIGNDTNALRGRQDRPWRNLQPALLATRPGDTVFIGPGSYPSIEAGVNGFFYLSNNVHLVGSGRGLTIIGTPGGSDDSISCRGGTMSIRDLTMHGIINVGASGIACTNALIDGVEVIGGADAIYVTTFEGVLTVNNCKLASLYDGISDWDLRPGGSNRVIRIFNSDIICTNGVPDGLSNPRRCIEGGDSRIEMYGGSLDCRDGFQHNSCVRLDVATFRTNKTGSILLSNVRLFHSTTNVGFTMQVSNFNRLPILLVNCTPEIFTPTLVNGSFTNAWEHRSIAFPNASTRTNWLVDVRSLTNALVAASEQGHTVRISDDLRTASGTNVLIYPSVGQTILGGATDGAGRSYTNLTINGGSMVLQIRSNYWTVIAKLP